MTPRDLRRDPQSGRWSAIAPRRGTRPGAKHTSTDICPFCTGSEHLTPPEVLVRGDGPTGWDVRVVPNLYPALERQEVVVHGPEHRESIADLSDSTLDAVAEAWQRRARDAGGNCFAFVNEGDAAGASQPHTHSQLAWLPEAPRTGALPPHVPVLERDGVLLGCAEASRAPYELVVAPLEAEPSGFESELLAPALRLLAAAVRRLHELAGARLPLNVWLLEGEHWRLELLPRGTRFAGLELGANVFVTTLAPEEAAGRLAGL